MLHKSLIHRTHCPLSENTSSTRTLCSVDCMTLVSLVLSYDYVFCGERAKILSEILETLKAVNIVPLHKGGSRTQVTSTSSTNIAHCKCRWEGGESSN